MGKQSLDPFDKGTGHRAGHNGHPGAFPGDVTVDEVCCDLLDGLFPRAGGTIWKSPIILKFKVPDSEQNRKTKWGVGNFRVSTSAYRNTRSASQINTFNPDFDTDHPRPNMSRFLRSSYPSDPSGFGTSFTHDHGRTATFIGSRNSTREGDIDISVFR